MSFDNCVESCVHHHKVQNSFIVPHNCLIPLFFFINPSHCCYSTPGNQWFCFHPCHFAFSRMSRKYNHKVCSLLSLPFSRLAWCICDILPCCRVCRWNACVSTLTAIGDHGLDQCSHWRWEKILPTRGCLTIEGDIFGCRPRSWVEYWHLVGRGQGCC